MFYEYDDPRREAVARLNKAASLRHMDTAGPHPEIARKQALRQARSYVHDARELRETGGLES